MVINVRLVVTLEGIHDEGDLGEAAGVLAMFSVFI